MCGAGLAPTAFEADWIQECGRPRPLPYRIIGSRCCKSGRRRQSNHNMVVRRFCMGASNPSSCEEQCLLPLITFIMSTGAFVMAAWAAARAATRARATARSPPARLRAKQSFVDRHYVFVSTRTLRGDELGLFGIAMEHDKAILSELQQSTDSLKWEHTAIHNDGRFVLTVGS
jgi:hypothetical protein